MQDRPDYVVIFLFFMLGVAAMMLLGHIINESIHSYNIHYISSPGMIGL